MEQNNPVLCPYCGAEMKQYNMEYVYWFVCGKCCSTSPKCTGRTGVYDRAQRRYVPPIRPLTAGYLLENSPCWLEERYEDGAWSLEIVSLAVNSRGNYHAYTFENPEPETYYKADYNRTWRCWPRRPTDEERAAAAWEVE